MSKTFALAFFALTIIIIVASTVIANKTIDIYTMIRALQVMVPACIVTAAIGYLLGRVLEQSKSDTKIFNSLPQQRYIDDLLIKPDEIIKKSSFIETSNINDGDYYNAENQFDAGSYPEEPVEKKIIE
ncbi:MAG: hypothetical protein PHX18_07025 [Candidatus Gastranaerophilales bacterium]|nr:hypothetical protein [Candidatus Gastranaerophilales bacterium]